MITHGHSTNQQFCYAHVKHWCSVIVYKYVYSLIYVYNDVALIFFMIVCGLSVVFYDVLLYVMAVGLAADTASFVVKYVDVPSTSFDNFFVFLLKVS